MTIACRVCGKNVEVEGLPTEGQPIECHHCQSTFEYHKIGLRRSAKVQPSDANNAMVDRVNARADAASRRRMWAKIRQAFTSMTAMIILAAIGFGVWKFYLHQQKTNVIPKTEETLQKPATPESTSKVLPKSNEATTTKVIKTTTEISSGSENAAMRFRGVRVDYWGRLDAAKRPGRVKGAFTLLMPVGKGDGRFYEITSTPTGITSVVACGGVGGEMTRTAYESAVKERGGFFCDGEHAWFVTATGSQKSWTAPTRSRDSFEPAQEYFGASYPLVEKYGMDTSGISFEVLFAIAKDAEAEIVGSCAWGGKVPYSAFRKIAERQILRIRERSLPPVDDKPYKRTVILYDGPTISKELSGVTKVPRQRPRAKTLDYRRWVKLYDEALRQEGEEQHHANEIRKAVSDRNRRLNAAVTNTEIESILCAGIVTIKRK